MRMSPYPCDFPQKTNNPKLTIRETSDKSQFWDILHNTSPALVKTVSVIKKQEKSEKLWQQGEMMIKCTVVPGWDPGTEKGH